MQHKNFFNRDANVRHLEIQEELRSKGASDYLIYNVLQLTYCFDQMCVNSVVVVNDTNLDDLKCLVDLAEHEKACVVFMFHRIKKNGEADYDNTWTYDYGKFENFAEYLAEKRDEGKIDVLTNRQAFLIGSSK